ncbi:MAG: adenylyl-sulfate kinase [Bacteroidota bacterium]|jgi:adenylylsulfate kinase-like enzyme
MIYWFTGQPGAGKTTIATKLKDLLQTEKRNWRKDVFHIDGDDLRELTLNKDYSEAGRIQNIKNAQLLAYFLQAKGCDIVVSLVSPYKELREEFKKECGENIVEIYVHTNRKRSREQFKVEDYQKPEENFFDLDTTSENATQSFTRLVHYLRETNKL